MYVVYTTFDSMQEAEKLAQKLVEEGLAACANIIPQVRSIYHWKGNLEKTEECICLFKTTKECFPHLEKSIEKHHSYETPCIVALPIAEVAKAYGEWLTEHVVVP